MYIKDTIRVISPIKREVRALKKTIIIDNDMAIYGQKIRTNQRDWKLLLFIS